MKLPELIRNIADANPTANPDRSVTLVVDSAPDAQIRDYFRSAVRNDVLDVLRVDRNANLVEDRDKTIADSASEPRRGVGRIPHGIRTRTACRAHTRSVVFEI